MAPSARGYRPVFTDLLIKNILLVSFDISQAAFKIVGRVALLEFSAAF